MYFSKIATTEQEFDAIAALNYETFVEEIPQHEQNSNKRIVDINFMLKIRISLFIATAAI